MPKKIIAIGSFAVLVLVVGSYLLLSRENNPSSQNAIPAKQPLTSQNADTSFQQTDSIIQTQIDQVDRDLNSINQINTQAPLKDDTSSINSL